MRRTYYTCKNCNKELYVKAYSSHPKHTRQLHCNKPEIKGLEIH